MDPKSSRGQTTWPFEFGIQTLASRYSYPFEVMMAGFLLSRSRPMDPESSWGLMRTIWIWDASTGIEILPPLRGHNYWINSVTFSPDGSKIISGSGDEKIRAWDASTGIEILPPLRGHNSRISSVAFSVWHGYSIPVRVRQYGYEK